MYCACVPILVKNFSSARCSQDVRPLCFALASSYAPRAYDHHGGLKLNVCCCENKLFR